MAAASRCFFCSPAIWVAGVSGVVMSLFALGTWLGWAAHVFVLYSFLALGDLLRHGRDIERAVAPRRARRRRVGMSRSWSAATPIRWTVPACRRAAVESLSENLTDGFTSALFWYVIGGLPLLTLFKVVSTMDSMVGYRTPRYLRFGWCGARLDDVMNFVPARADVAARGGGRGGVAGLFRA